MAPELSVVKAWRSLKNSGVDSRIRLNHLDPDDVEDDRKPGGKKRSGKNTWYFGNHAQSSVIIETSGLFADAAGMNYSFPFANSSD